MGAEDIGLAGIFDVYAFSLSESVKRRHARQCVIDRIVRKTIVSQFMLPLPRMSVNGLKNIEPISMSEEGSPALKSEPIGALGMGAIGSAAFKTQPFLNYVR